MESARAVCWATEADTERSAHRLATVLLDTAPGSGLDGLIALHGDLGAGKTAFARHLLRALGVVGRVRSPTYALLESYAVDRPGGRLELSHLDFYRFDDPSEWVDSGLREPFERPGLRLVEWPQKARGLLPPADLDLTITVAPAASPEATDARHVHAEAGSNQGRRWLGRWLGTDPGHRP